MTDEPKRKRGMQKGTKRKPRETIQTDTSYIAILTEPCPCDDCPLHLPCRLLEIACAQYARYVGELRVPFHWSELTKEPDKEHYDLIYVEAKDRIQPQTRKDRPL